MTNNWAIVALAVFAAIGLAHTCVWIWKTFRKVAGIIDDLSKALRESVDLVRELRGDFGAIRGAMMDQESRHDMPQPDLLREIMQPPSRFDKPVEEDAVEVPHQELVPTPEEEELWSIENGFKATEE